MTHLEDLFERWRHGTLTHTEQDELVRQLETPAGRRLLAEDFCYAEAISSALGGTAPVCERQETDATTQPAQIAAFRTAPTRRVVRHLSVRIAAVVTLAGAAAVALWWLSGILFPNVAPAPDQDLADRPHVVTAGRVFLDGAKQVAIVPEGTEIQIPNDGAAMVDLADGSRAELDPGTRAVVHGPFHDVRQMIELVEGAGTFHVEKGDGSFQVETKIGRVTALGTEFKVRLTGDRLAVNVRTGLVSVDVGSRNYLLTGPESRVFSPEVRRQQEIRGFVARVSTGRIALNRWRGSENDFALRPNLAVTIDGRPGRLAELSPGMIVHLELDDDQRTVSRVRTEGPTVGGEIRTIDARSRKITLGSRRAGRTEAERAFTLAADTPIGVDGKPTSLDELQPGSWALLRLSADRTKVIQVDVGREVAPANRKPSPRTRESKSE